MTGTEAPRGDDPRRVDLRSGPERRVRRAWRRGAGLFLRTAGLLYGAAVDARNFLYESGVLRSVRPPVPVVSVGGLTAGGSGKTPLASELAARLEGPTREVGVVTHGFADELEVHRRLRPGRIVEGDPTRIAAVARAAGAGADVVVVDSGLQRRRLARAFDVVAVSGAEAAGARRRLPAGPLRERWAELARADGVVLTRRPGTPTPTAGFHRWLRQRLPHVLSASCELHPGDLVPVNRAAGRQQEADPAVAVASVMHPEPFLHDLRSRGLTPEVVVLASDHELPSRRRLAELIDRAGERGMVGTLKDAVKLRGPVAEETPLWYVEDEVSWTRGRPALIERIERTLEEAP